MKNGKRPTLVQKMLMRKANLKEYEWLVVKNLPGELHIVHRETKELKVI